jgi:molybdopterin synthase sulfur carrier subunit
MATIEIRLFANLAAKSPLNSQAYLIEPGTSVGELLHGLQVSPNEAKLIFVDGVRSNLNTSLMGGERVGIFPPVGGG